MCSNQYLTSTLFLMIMSALAHLPNDICTLSTRHYCIKCSVEKSSREEFEDQFQNKMMHDDDCQVHIDTQFQEFVTAVKLDEDRSSEFQLQMMVFSLGTHLGQVDSTERILFRLTYESLGGTNVTEYDAVNVELRGSDRDMLPQMRIPIPIESADLDKKVNVVSHSKKACGGLWTEFTVDPVVGNVSYVEFEPVENQGCVYKHMIRVEKPFDPPQEKVNQPRDEDDPTTNDSNASMFKFYGILLAACLLVPLVGALLLGGRYLICSCINAVVRPENRLIPCIVNNQNEFALRLRQINNDDTSGGSNSSRVHDDLYPEIVSGVPLNPNSDALCDSNLIADAPSSSTYDQSDRESVLSSGDDLEISAA